MDPAARDEAVRRLRAESARRRDRRNRARAVFSSCVRAILATGLMVTALYAHDMRLLRQAHEAAAVAAMERTRLEREFSFACARTEWRRARWKRCAQPGALCLQLPELDVGERDLPSRR